MSTKCDSSLRSSCYNRGVSKYLAFLLPVLLVPAVAAAAVETYTFSHTGAVQTFVVPPYTTSIKAKLWGGGGAAYMYRGGGGGHTIGTFSATPGETLTLVVAGGGGTSAAGPGFGGGGPSSYAAPRVSAGGGYSAIFRGACTEGSSCDTSNVVVVAGGGGGGGCWAGCTGSSGGAGGGLVGQDGIRYTGTPNTVGQGGTQTAGGAGGFGNPGGAFRGGSGHSLNVFWGTGGGGGGGYFGGGGGAVGQPYGYGGGGGSGFCNGIGVTECITVMGDATVPGGSGDPDKPAGVGDGGWTLTWPGGNGFIKLEVTTVPPIVDPGPPPTATMTTDAPLVDGSYTIEAGKTARVTANFEANDDDTLSATAINGSDQVNSVPCGQVTPSHAQCWQQPDAQKVYSFTPTATGVYTFYAAARTANYANYDNYASITIRVVPATCTDPHAVPPSCTTCELGYEMRGGVCAPVQCEDPHAVEPLCSSCDAGYSMRGGVCMVVPNLSLSVLESRVAKGRPATITWLVSGLTAGAGQSCSVTSNPAGVASHTMAPNTAPTWYGNRIATGPIQSTTIFTLSCSGETPVSVTVNLVPNIIEE